MNIIHISFTEKEHKEALSQLRTERQGVRLDTDELCANHICHLLSEYLRGRLQSVPYSVQSPFYRKGTDFQKKVWVLIARIPHGRTKTYADIASSLGNVRLARAVGRACGANPLALVIPCHRVVGSNGLGGFAGGVAIKSKLLEIEKE